MLSSRVRIRGGNRAGRTGLGRANSGPGQNRVGLKLARFFRAKILTAQPVLKTGSVGPNSLFKVKKNLDRSDRVGPYRTEPYRIGPILPPLVRMPIHVFINVCKEKFYKVKMNCFLVF